MNEYHARKISSQESKVVGKDDYKNVSVAIVQENGGNVTIYDADGEGRSFSYKGKTNGKKLCFSTHGAKKC